MCFTQHLNDEAITKNALIMPIISKFGMAFLYSQ